MSAKADDEPTWSIKSEDLKRLQQNDPPATASSIMKSSIMSAKADDEPTKSEYLKRLQRNDPTLTGLKLDPFAITDVDAEAFFEALTINKTLTNLDLGGNQITDVGATKLAEALTTNKTLTNLYLGRNRITAVGANKLAEALANNSMLAKELSASAVSVKSSDEAVTKPVKPTLPYTQECSVQPIDGSYPDLSSEPHGRESMGGNDPLGAPGNWRGRGGNDEKKPGKDRRALIKAHTSGKSGIHALIIVNEDRNCRATVIVGEPGQTVTTDSRTGVGATGGVTGGGASVDLERTTEYQPQMSNQLVVLEPGTQRVVTVSSGTVSLSILFKTGETDYYYLLEAGVLCNVKSQYFVIQHGCLSENPSRMPVVLHMDCGLHTFSFYVEPVAPRCNIL